MHVDFVDSFWQVKIKRDRCYSSPKPHTSVSFTFIETAVNCNMPPQTTVSSNFDIKENLICMLVLMNTCHLNISYSDEM